MGFTTLELMVTLIIAAILAAIAGPSLLRWKADYDVRRAIDESAQTFIYFQRESIRSNPSDSQSPTATGCRFSVTNTAYSGSPGIASSNCAQGNLKFENGVTIDTSASTLGSNIKFSALGSIILSSAGRVVLQSSNTPVRRCLQMSQPLGMIRTGRWVNGSCT